MPVSVSVSPLRSKLKSGMSTAALNKPPSPVKSGALTPALMFRLSVKLTSAPKVPRKVSSNAFFAFRSGRSPVSVKPLPLRTIDSGANDRPGRLPVGVLRLGALTLGVVRVAV